MNQIESTKMYSDFVEEVNELFDSRNIKRKYTNEPYWKHLERVTKIVEDYISIDVSMWTKEHMSFHSCLRFAAYGHDVFEDIDSAYNFKCFNKYHNPSVCNTIYSGIRHLTDVFTKERYPYFNRAQRKLLEAHRLSKIPLFAMYVKLADLYDNTSDITENDEGFAITYIKEKSVILKLMYQHNHHIRNAILYNDCLNQVRKFSSKLKIKNIVF